MKLADQLESHKGVLKLSAFAEIMGVCYMTAYRWARYSGLPAYKIAGSYWIDPYEAARWWRDRALTVTRSPRPLRRGRPSGGRNLTPAAPGESIN